MLLGEKKKTYSSRFPPGGFNSNHTKKSFRLSSDGRNTLVSTLVRVYILRNFETYRSETGQAMKEEPRDSATLCTI